jgi:hypothetical protein
MDWHEAYLAQARSDYAVLKRLDKSDVPYCHRLHYLQMVSEKLGKAVLTPAGSNQPAPKVHRFLVRMLQTLKGDPVIRRRLKYGTNVGAFRNYIDSLLDLAAKIERLSPDQAGYVLPNPEYPWWTDKTKSQVVAPTDYDFPAFNPRDQKMTLMNLLLEELIKLPI